MKSGNITVSVRFDFATRQELGRYCEYMRNTHGVALTPSAAIRALTLQGLVNAREGRLRAERVEFARNHSGWSRRYVKGLERGTMHDVGGKELSFEDFVWLHRDDIDKTREIVAEAASWKRKKRDR